MSGPVLYGSLGTKRRRGVRYVAFCYRWVSFGSRGKLCSGWFRAGRAGYDSVLLGSYGMLSYGEALQGTLRCVECMAVMASPGFVR